MVGIIDAQITNAATPNLANTNLIIEVSLGAALQKPRVERIWQERSDVDNFILALQVRQRDLGLLAVLQMICRQVPHGGVSCSVSTTTTRSVKLRSHSDKAFQIATRSAQTVRP